MGEVRSKRRVPLARGEKIAEVVRAHIERFTQTMVLVGSIRRKRPEIADVEFVILPRDIEEFDQVVTRLGFDRGTKRRKYTGRSGGLKVELYVAHEPEELGALVLAYTGDWLFNVAMRSQAKRMGFKMDQYGIWKGKKPALRSPDEKEFFDFLGMDWHAPEERSLSQRGELRKTVKALLARRLPEESRAAVERAAEILKGRDPLPFDLEEEIRNLSRRFNVSMGAEMGFQPVPDEEVRDVRRIVQELYDRDVGRGGSVLLLDLNIAYGIVQVITEVQEANENVVYLLLEITDLPEEAVIRAEIDPGSFLESITEMADRGEVKFTWEGPWRPMAE